MRMMEKRNTDFIKSEGYCCPICGREETVPSIIKLYANYGSREHDGEIITVHVCGECIDKVIDKATNFLNEGDMDTEYSLLP